MKFKVIIYDDDEEAIDSKSLDIGRDEDLVWEKVGELAQGLVVKHQALDECESCYGKFQSFDERVPDRDICKSCAENMANPLNEPCNE